MSVPAEVLKKVKMLEIATRKLVNSQLAGQYHSAFKGQGMTFAEFREYVPGDDVRAISWPVTARTGKTHIKKFDEERELTVMLLVDISASTIFGSKKMIKGEAIANVAALLGFAASRNNDYVGLLLYTDQVEHFVPPKKGRGHIYRILRDLIFLKPSGRKTNLNAAVDHLQGILRKRSTVFVLSDFIEKDWSRPLARLAKKHDTIAIRFDDPLERELPKMGLVDFLDPESGELLTVDTSDKDVQKAFLQLTQKRILMLDQEMSRINVGRILVPLENDVFDPVINYFRRRNGLRARA